MHVVVFVPQQYAAAVLAVVSQHRGLVRSSEYRDGTQTIRARVPQAEVPGFTAKLLRQTDGRARFSMVLYEYWPIAPPPTGEPEAGVREPRPRVPVLRSGAMEVPEPD